MPQRYFSSLHPVPRLLFFAFALISAFCSLQPICAAIALFGAAANLLFCQGWAKLLRWLPGIGGIILLVGLANGLFAGLGSSLLFSIGSLQVYAESCAYGACMGCMLASSLLWFACFESLVGQDSFLSLFGELFPLASLMILRGIALVPQLLTSLRDCNDARRVVLGAAPGSLRERSADAAAVFGSVLCASLEDCIATADAMRARGFGAVERSSYRPQAWSSADSALCVVLILVIPLNALLLYTAVSSYSFYPLMPRLFFWWAYLPYLFSLLLPLICEAAGALMRAVRRPSAPDPLTEFSRHV